MPVADSLTSPDIKTLLSADELAQVTRKSNWRGAWALFSTWLMIAAIFGLAAWQPHAPVLLLCVILLGGRQLALAVLQHEGAHRTLFRSRWANDVLTDILAARPIWLHQSKYRAHHVHHHRHTGMPDDPDMSLREPYPCSRLSLLRKFARDISGLTGLKLVFGLLLMDLGLIRWTVSTDIQWLPQEGRAWWSYPLALLRNTGPVVLLNALLFGVLWACGAGWLYGLWLLAFLTAFPTVTRIRSIAEHACTPAVPDVGLNTRTTRAGWLARVLVAPMQVNYHREHHLMMSVPAYRLAELHRLLRARGAAPRPPSYWQVLRQAAA